jgi:hypothetical protein
MSTKLKYFNSVKVPENLLEVFQALEDILQQEHGVDGGHRLASTTQAGMISADDKKKLDSLSVNTTSQTITVVSGTGTGGVTTGEGGTGGTIFNPQFKVATGVNNSTGVTFTFTTPYTGVNLYTCHVSCTKGDGGGFRNVGYKRTKTQDYVTVIPVENDCTVEIICYAIPS